MTAFGRLLDRLLTLMKSLLQHAASHIYRVAACQYNINQRASLLDLRRGRYPSIPCRHRHAKIFGHIARRHAGG